MKSQHIRYQGYGIELCTQREKDDTCVCRAKFEGMELEERGASSGEAQKKALEAAKIQIDILERLKGHE